MRSRVLGGDVLDETRASNEQLWTLIALARDANEEQARFLTRAAAAAAA